MSVSLFILSHPFPFILRENENYHLLSVFSYLFDQAKLPWLAKPPLRISSSNLMCHKMFQKDILLLLGVLVKFSKQNQSEFCTKRRPDKEEVTGL